MIFVERATIDEISVVEAGACEVAFSRLIDANHSPSLKESLRY